jgi:transposase
MTYLRSLLRFSVPPVDQVKHVGIDDFAWKRGKSYGTVVVDLDSHAIIDLIPDREAATVQHWLETHEEVEIVSRDRGGAYADGATQGAPQAQQCADRWHLCANLGEAVERFLIRTHTQLPEPQSTETEWPVEAGTVSPLSSYSATPAQQGRTQARLLRKWKVYQRVKELHAEGMSLRRIGEELGLARNTVRKYAPPNLLNPQGLCHGPFVPACSILTMTICWSS